jgi:tetratricopeptide (TPR) repeat protein
VRLHHSRVRTGLRTAALFLFIAIGTARAQWIADPVIDQKVQTGIDHIYNFEFPEAERSFDEVVALRPDHPVGHFFRAMIQWEKILSNFDDETQDQRLYDLLDVVIEMCDKRLDDDSRDITALFFKGGAVGFRGRLRANRSKWAAAANDGLTALPLVRKAYELDQNNYDILLGIGIYNYYAAIVPDKYPVVKPLMIFFPSGDRVKGLEQLRQASLHAKYASVEAMYFLMQNEFMYEKEFPKALELARTLSGRYPRNPVFHRYLGRCLVATGFLDEANRVFVEVERRYANKQTGYDRYDGREAYYYMGRNELTAKRYEAALKYLYLCDELSRVLDKEGPSGFMSMGNLLIGMVYDAQGKRELAVAQYNKVLDMKEYETSHTDAKRYLETPYRNN